MPSARIGTRLAFLLWVVNQPGLQPHIEPGHGEVPEALGSVGIGLALSGSHKIGEWSNFPLPTVAAVTVQLFTDPHWGGVDRGALPSTELLQQPCPMVAPRGPRAKPGLPGPVSCSPASCLHVSLSQLSCSGHPQEDAQRPQAGKASQKKSGSHHPTLARTECEAGLLRGQGLAGALSLLAQDCSTLELPGNSTHYPSCPG